MHKQLIPHFPDYELIDSGNFEKLERFGRYVTRRPEPQAIWRKNLSEQQWGEYADASFSKDVRSDDSGQWSGSKSMPSQWGIKYDYKDMSLRMNLRLMSFKHVGIFPEQSENWNFIYDNVQTIKERGIKPKVLNLFAYTGGATLAACAAGADVTHVDSVKQVVSWSRENMECSGLDGVRWIVEDALKFVQREVRRGKKYNGIIFDPPAYGRGTNGERWILEDHICEMLECCSELLEPQDSFLVFNLYSMGLSSMLARTAVHEAFGAPKSEEFGDLYFEDKFKKQIPFGTYYRFER